MFARRYRIRAGRAFWHGYYSAQDSIENAIAARRGPRRGYLDRVLDGHVSAALGTPDGYPRGRGDGLPLA